jgi:hypothetical protein
VYVFVDGFAYGRKLIIKIYGIGNAVKAANTYAHDDDKRETRGRGTPTDYTPHACLV